MNPKVGDLISFKQTEDERKYQILEVRKIPPGILVWGPNRNNGGGDSVSFIPQENLHKFEIVESE